MINKNSVNNLNWDDIFKLWESLNVPEVDFIKFQFKPKTKSNKEFIKYMKQRNVGGSPWHCKKDTIIANSNIQQQTAEHLFHLKDKSDELKTAYKLNAFCVMTQSWDFSREMLNPVFLKYNQLDSRHWWAWRAKNVLPFTGLDYHFPQVNFKNWINIVNYAAKEWKTVAENWEIKIITVYDEKAKEYQAYSYEECSFKIIEKEYPEKMKHR